jgi:hypothetical protein
VAVRLLPLWGVIREAAEVVGGPSEAVAEVVAGKEAEVRPEVTVVVEVGGGGAMMAVLGEAVVGQATRRRADGAVLLLAGVVGVLLAAAGVGGRCVPPSTLSTVAPMVISASSCTSDGDQCDFLHE